MGDVSTAEAKAKLAEVEALTQRMLECCEGQTPEIASIALSTALYTVVWGAVHSAGVPPVEEGCAITALVEASLAYGTMLAQAAIANGDVDVRVRPEGAE